MKLTILFCLVLVFLFSACCTTRESTQVSEMDTLTQENDDVELNFKLFLVEKYRPGNCYGMPDPDPFYYKNSDKDTLLQRIKSLLPGRDDSEYMLLTQMTRGIKLQKTGNGAYEFEFSDGQCCTVYHYKGVVEMKAGIIEDNVIEKTSETVPC